MDPERNARPAIELETIEAAPVPEAATQELVRMRDGVRPRRGRTVAGGARPPPV
jgi:hypothetical protein